MTTITTQAWNKGKKMSPRAKVSNKHLVYAELCQKASANHYEVARLLRRPEDADLYAANMESARIYAYRARVYLGVE